MLQTSPRLAFLMPDFQNPTGALVPTDQRQAVVAAARRSGTRLVIDESFVDLDLRSDGEQHRLPEPMAALDPSVISLGSLSKQIWGGLRVGWLRADPDTVQRLAVVRARGDMGGAVIEQLIADQLLRKLAPMTRTRCAQLRGRRDTLLDALNHRLPGWRTSRPAGGLSTWVELDAPSATLLTAALEQRGVLLNPGSRFTPVGTLERFLRLPFALPSPALVEAVDILADTWAQLDVSPIAVHRDPAILTA
jgi:DNA-binding transcriptional MocR family regulator